MRSIAYWKNKLESCQTEDEVRSILVQAERIEIVGSLRGNKPIHSAYARVIFGTGKDDDEVWYQSAGAVICRSDSKAEAKIDGRIVKMINTVLAEMLSEKKIIWHR